MSARSVAVGCCSLVLFLAAFAPIEALARPRGGGAVSAPVRAAPAAVPRANVHHGRHGGHVGARTKNLGVGRIHHGQHHHFNHHGKHHHSNHHGKHHHAAHDRRFKHHVRRHTWPADLGFYGPVYGPVYDPGVYQPVQSGPIIVTANGPAPGPERVAVGSGCRSYAVIVPSEAGGERKVTITECNQP
jgi:hypothetical protein